MFSRIFVERPRLAAVISIVMVIAGLASLPQLPVAEFPELAPPQIQVMAKYTGANAQVLADTVAIPLEAEINGIEDLLYFSSTSNDSGKYACSLTFKIGTDANMAFINTQNAIKAAEKKLPTEVVNSGITVRKRSADMLAQFTFITDGTVMSRMELSNYVSTNVIDAISRIDGVSAAEIMGTEKYAMRIWLDPIRAAGLRISSDDIATAIRAQNIQAAVGSVGSENGNRYLEYKLTVQGRLRTVDEFENIVVRSENKRIVRLKDIARVELGANAYLGGSTYNGVESIAMVIYRNTDSNALAVVQKVRAVLDDMSTRFAKGVSYTASYDPTEFIVISLKEIVVTLLVALALVILITYVFLQDWRATLIPAIAIPVSLLATFPVMLALGYSINVLTMFGLILVIGSLVDDAIVVVENVLALMEREGLTAKEAAIKSMTQITGAIVATTLVTLACYVPLAFYGGMVGKIYMQFSVVMCIALCFSTIVALTLSPALCSILLGKSSKKPLRIFKPFNSGMDKAKGIYLRGATIFVRRAALTVFFLGACVVGITILNDRLPTSFIPPEDKGTIMCDIALPAGATIERTNAALAELGKRLATIPGIKSYSTVSGRGRLYGNGENIASAVIILDDWTKRTTPELQIDAILAEIQRKTEDIASARISSFTPPAIMGLGSTGGISFMLSGEGDVDPVELADLARSFAKELTSSPGVAYAMTSYSADTPQLRLDIDREKAEMLQVPVKRIFTALQSKLSAYYINDFNFLGDTFDVQLQADRGFRSTIADIRDVQVTSTTGANVPLGSLGKINYTVGPREIVRFNKYSSAGINARIRPGVASGDVMKTIEEMEMPSNFHVEWTGLSYQERQNQGQIVYLMAFALIFAYLFLVGQYESWTIPIPVMLSVVFAIAGALGGLWVAGMSLSIYAQLGLVMLIGLAAKNAILMVEFSMEERKRGKSVFESALSGASLRFRAVLMTALSFIFGVFPLVIATGAGAASRRAIGITTFSGMLLATTVGLFFVPALYAACQRLREWTSALKESVKSGRLGKYNNISQKH